MEAKKAKKNKLRGIKNSFIVIIICFIVALVVFTQVLGSPDNFEGGDPAGGHPLNLLGTIYKGGFIVPILQTLLLTVIVLSVERFIAMLSVKGKGSVDKFVAAVKVKNRYVRLVVDSLAMSFCAQLLTVPLVAYVFHSVSLYSSFVTLVLTPITAVLIYMMPLLWTVNVILPWGAAWLAGILTLLIKLQHQILQLVVELPGAVLTCYPDIRVVILVYLLLLIWMCRPFLSFVWWVRSNVFIVVLLTGAMYYSYWQKERLQPSLVFYNNTSCPAAHLVRTRDRSYLIPVHVDSVSAHMRYIAESYWDKCLKSYPHLVGTGYDDGYVRCYQGIVFSPDVSFVVLSDDRWNACVPGSPLRIDYLYVCRGFYGKLSSLQTVFRPGTVVLDASLSKRQNERLADECRRLKWTFYDMRLSG